MNETISAFLFWTTPQGGKSHWWNLNAISCRCPTTTDTQIQRIGGLSNFCNHFICWGFLSVYLASLTFGSSIRCTTLIKSVSYYVTIWHWGYTVKSKKVQNTELGASCKTLFESFPRFHLGFCKNLLVQYIFSAVKFSV